MPTAATAPATDSFERLVEPLRPELHAHCYRMLGSLHDAEDAFQEAMLRAWRRQETLEDTGALRAWLYRIATNVCLDAIKRRPKRVLPVDYGPPSNPDWRPGSTPSIESVWVEPYPDEELGVEDGYASPEATYEQREAVELAFVVALQHLPAIQRAALIFREVLGYSAKETADALDTSTASVNSALQRARKSIAEMLPERSQQATLRSLGDDGARRVAEAYADAWSRNDIEGIAAMLAEDVVMAMPPDTAWWRGRETVLELRKELEGQCAENRCLLTRANGQLAFGWYSWNEDEQRFLASALEVVTLDGDRISDVTAFIQPELHQRFGLPESLAD